MEPVQTNTKIYFGSATERAVEEYMACDCDEGRSAIYYSKLYKPFDTLISKLIGKFNLTTDPQSTGELKAEIHFKILHDALPQFNSDKGKAFSLLTRTVINFLLAERMKRQAKKIKFDELDVVDIQRNTDVESANEIGVDTLHEFIGKWVEWYDERMYQLGYDVKNELPIVDSILELFRSIDSIQIFNRKALYILIRDRTGLPTSKITPVIKRMKLDFDEMYKTFLKTDKIITPNIYNRNSNEFWN